MVNAPDTGVNQKKMTTKKHPVMNDLPPLVRSFSSWITEKGQVKQEMDTSIETTPESPPPSNQCFSLSLTVPKSEKKETCLSIVTRIFEKTLKPKPMDSSIRNQEEANQVKSVAPISIDHPFHQKNKDANRENNDDDQSDKKRNVDETPSIQIKIENDGHHHHELPLDEVTGAKSHFQDVRNSQQVSDSILAYLNLIPKPSETLPLPSNEEDYMATKSSTSQDFSPPGRVFEEPMDMDWTLFNDLLFTDVDSHHDDNDIVEKFLQLRQPQPISLIVLDALASLLDGSSSDSDPDENLPKEPTELDKLWRSVYDSLVNEGWTSGNHSIVELYESCYGIPGSLADYLFGELDIK